MRPILRMLVPAIVLLAFGPVHAARAHPALDEARARFDGADFAVALRLLDAAERRTDLSAADLEVLLELRAMASLAASDLEAMERALTGLASFAPGHRFGRDAPPEVDAAFARARARSAGTVRVVVAAERRDATVQVRARVDNDPTSLTREVRLWVRVGHGRWQPAVDGQVSVTATGREAIEYCAVAIGPGGAELAIDGTPGHPRRVSAPDLRSVDLRVGGANGNGGDGRSNGNSIGNDLGNGDGNRDGHRRDTGGGISPWIWVAIGAVAIGAGVTIAVVATGSESDITRPMPPRIVP